MKKELLGYVVGNGLTTNYANELSIFQGTEKVLSIDVFKTFTTKNSSGVEITSNKVLLRTLTTPATAQREVVPFSVNYNQLAYSLHLPILLSLLLLATSCGTESKAVDICRRLTEPGNSEWNKENQ